MKFFSMVVAHTITLRGTERELQKALLHSCFWNFNLYGSVRIGHSDCVHEEYQDIKKVIDLLQCNLHQWIICVDLEMVCFLLDQQRVYTKYPCFLCIWDTRAREKHWVLSKCPSRCDLKPGDPNILN
ncbi:hypothetical protein WA026_012091 [Henosepilachna vigintioctopunctata]|uniref:Uncharacterized protein n=1 Tax=Henosepilachna vigintioctopunctata TaxID=420089 RepID=A0AAW1VBA2_9CUCU